ncbi:MAG TPA: TIGR02391 family protein [Burkholderiales bacterium]|nr:TIGR02391 family protein [Burkholderiales bacterium]
MSKVAKKIGKKNIIAVNSMVSRKAAKLGVSAEAALIILAKEYGIGTSTYQRSLEATKQAEIRDALPTIFAPGVRITNNVSKLTKKTAPIRSKRAQLKLAIEYLIQDNELRDRCGDILLAPSKFDRPINQATLVLEDRIRKKAQPNKKLVGESLVNFAFNEDLSKTVLHVASNDPDDQRGFTQIIRGIVPAFRNKTHHHIINSFSREDAMRVCGFIDVLLRVVDNTVKM